MSKPYHFNIQGYIILQKYDTNHDRKLQREELNIWLQDNNLEYVNNKIIPKGNIYQFTTHQLLSDVPPFKKESFDGEIGASYQSRKTGDCWLLSGINALANTSWGRKIIKDAIKPDALGGVTVTFKDKNLEQKEYYISKDEITKARQSGSYSSGDSDVLALELATEKCFDKLLKEGKLWKDSYFTAKYGNKSIAGAPKKLSNGESYLVEELLTGIKPIDINDCGNNNFDKKLLKEIAENKDDYSVQVCFTPLTDIFSTRPEGEKFHGGHAYMIKNINYGKNVTLSDPYYPDMPFTIDFNRFLEEVINMTVLPNPNKKTNINNYRIDNYKKCFGNTEKEDLDEHIRSDEEYKKEKAKREENINKLQAKEDERLLKIEYENFLKTALRGNCDNAKKFKINKTNILKIFENYNSCGALSINLKYLVSSIYISQYDKDQKIYILKPIVKALADVAKDCNINKTIIENFENNCNKYLDSFICFNRAEKVTNEIIKMYNLIQQKQKNK